MPGTEQQNKPPRRTHAERSAGTREKIIAAVIACISENGFKRTTANAIAKKAGVTWGALQHHFGGVSGCYAAALQDSFQRFAEQVGEVPDTAQTLDQRLSTFLDRAWTHYQSAHFLSMLQLLLNDLTDMYEPKEWQKLQKDIILSMDDVWRSFFQDAIPDTTIRQSMARYTHSVLTGMAVSYSFRWGGKGADKKDLEVLRYSLIKMIEA